MNIDNYIDLILITRQTARKYKIKVFEINCIYTSYLINKKDTSMYLNRFILGRTIAKSYRCKNANQLIMHGLINKIESDVYLFTPLAVDVLNYIDEQLKTLTNV